MTFSQLRLEHLRLDRECTGDHNDVPRFRPSRITVRSPMTSPARTGTGSSAPSTLRRNTTVSPFELHQRIRGHCELGGGAAVALPVKPPRSTPRRSRRHAGDRPYWAPRSGSRHCGWPRTCGGRAHHLAGQALATDHDGCLRSRLRRATPCRLATWRRPTPSTSSTRRNSVLPGSMRSPTTKSSSVIRPACGAVSVNSPLTRPLGVPGRP